MDSFEAALDAELFGSEGEESLKEPPETSMDDACGDEGGGEGDGEGGGEANPFAALDDLEVAEQHAPAAAPPPTGAAPVCSHPGFMFGLCIRCGAPKPEDGDQGAAAGAAAPAPLRDSTHDGSGGESSGGGGAGGGGTQARPSVARGGMRIKHLHARQTLEVRAGAVGWGS